MPPNDDGGPAGPDGQDPPRRASSVQDGPSTAPQPYRPTCWRGPAKPPAGDAARACGHCRHGRPAARFVRPRPGLPRRSDRTRSCCRSPGLRPPRPPRYHATQSAPSGSSASAAAGARCERRVARNPLAPMRRKRPEGFPRTVSDRRPLPCRSRVWVTGGGQAAICSSAATRPVLRSFTAFFPIDALDGVRGPTGSVPEDVERPHWNVPIRGSSISSRSTPKTVKTAADAHHDQQTSARARYRIEMDQARGESTAD